MSSSAHTVTVSFFGSTKDLEAKMATLGLEADKAGGSIGSSFEKGGQKAGGALSKLGTTLGNFGLPFGNSISGIGSHFEEVEGKGKTFGGVMQEVGKVSVLALGAAAIAAIAEGLKMGEAFQKSTDSIATHAGITVKAAQQISNAFLHTSGDVLESGQQIADAYAPVAGVFTSLYGHALDSTDALTVMTAASDLASASGEDLTSVTAALAAVMASYGIPVKDAAATTDELLNISKATGQPISTLSDGIDKLHGKLGTTAPTLSDVGGLVEALGHQGLTGSRGMLVASTAFSTLEGGSKATNTELKNLGVSIYDANGKFVGMQGVISQLQPKLAGMTDAQKELTLKTLFGASAAQVMGGIIAKGPSQFDALTTSVGKAGTAHAAAAINAGSLQGEEEQLKKNVDNLGTTLGEALVPVMQKVITATMTAVKWAENHAGIMEALAGVVGTVVVAAIAVYVGSLVAATAVSVAKFAEMVAKGAWWVATHIAQLAVWVATTAASVATVMALWVAHAATWIASTVASVATFVATHAAMAASFIAENVMMVASATAAFIAENLATLGIIAGITLLVGAIIYMATHWKQVWSDIEKIATDAWHFIDSNLVQPIGNFFGTTLPGFLDKGVQFFTDLPGRIISALGNVGSMLYDAGKSIIEGFLKGIEDTFKDVTKFVGGIAHTIASLKGPISYDAVLLIPHGNAIMGGLAVGLQQGFNGPVTATLGGITRSLGSSGMSPLVGSAGRGVGTQGGVNLTYSPVVTITGTSEQIANQTKKMITDSHQQMVDLIETRLAHQG